MATYGARIRAARSYADLSQEKLAEHLGVDAQTIKRRESGSQIPKKQELIAIAAITGVPLAFLTDGFGGSARDELVERLTTLEDAVRQLAADEFERELARQGDRRPGQHGDAVA